LAPVALVALLNGDLLGAIQYLALLLQQVAVAVVTAQIRLTAMV
jgi:hypothetical protein